MRVRCMLFIQQKYINFERFQAGVTVNMTKKAYYGGHMLYRSVSAPYLTLSYHLQAPLPPLALSE